MKKELITMMRGAIVVLVLMLAYPHTSAGQYNISAGVRIGGTTGATAKFAYRPNIFAEGIIGSFGNGFSLTGLCERYVPVYSEPGFYVFYGGGFHMAFYNGLNRRYGYFGREVDYRNNNDVGIGVNGIVGLEYRFPKKIPIALSLDLKPFVEVGSGGYVSFAPDPSVGVKVILK